jgi:hypothetical protein
MTAVRGKEFMMEDFNYLQVLEDQWFIQTSRQPGCLFSLFRKGEHVMELSRRDINVLLGFHEHLVMRNDLPLPYKLPDNPWLLFMDGAGYVWIVWGERTRKRDPPEAALVYFFSPKVLEQLYMFFMTML